MISTENKEILDEALNTYFSFILTEGICSNNSEHSWKQSLIDYYIGLAKEESLGSRTTLITIPDLDLEVLVIGNRLKLFRAGSYAYFSMAGSKPEELSKNRILERLRLIDDDFTLEKGDTEDEEREWLLIHGDNIYSRGEWVLFPDVVKEGYSFTNLKKKHYAWIINTYENGVSIDKDFFETTEKIASVEYRLHKCEGCGDLIIENWRTCPVCSCLYEECNHCHRLILKKEGVWSGAKFYCKECAKKPKCKGCGHILNNDEDRLCDRCEELEGILSYHAGYGRQDESGGSRFRIGFEVEKEDMTMQREVSENAKEILRNTGWTTERDGSLSRYGFEMISPIYPLDIDVIGKKIEPLAEELSSKTTDRCGGHIHVSDKERTPYDILLDIRGYLPLLYGLYPSRATNEYCEAKEKFSYIEQGHRQALNITNRTLEFRIFPAVKNSSQLLFRARLIKYMLENKETDVVKVGELLLDENSELYKLLNTRITKEKLKEKAKAFIDFANYIERDGLVIEDSTVKRVIKIPQVKLEKEADFERRTLGISKRCKDEQAYVYSPLRTLSKNSYGYFADRVK